MSMEEGGKNKKMSMEVLEFPPDITIDILSRLPMESVLECKCVCKTWQTLIQDPIFLATYTARHGDGEESLGFCIMGHRQDCGYGSAVIHYGEYRPSNANFETGGALCFKVTKPTKSPHKWFNEDITAKWSLIGSSNGLICLSACRHGRNEPTYYNIYIYNPMTKEYVNLGPETFTSFGKGQGYRTMGFGYHPFTKEYKVIIINYESCYSSGHVKVYTLGGSRWRDKGEIPYGVTTLYKPGILVNGALHWLTNDHRIMCFDLADEKFRNVPVPPGIVLCKHDKLGVLGGCLCVYMNISISVWLLKDYMMDKSWTKIFSRENVYGPLEEEDIDVSLRSNVAFVSHLYFKKKIVPYDSESESIGSKIECLQIRNSYTKLHTVAYTRSFVSLKALGEENVQYIGHFQKEFPFWLQKYFKQTEAHQPQWFV